VGWTLCVAVPMSIIQDDVQEADRSILYAFLTFVGVILIIVILAVVAVNKVAANITEPIKRLGQDMQVISDGDLNYRAAVCRNDEIGDITGQMNEMVDRLKFTMKELLDSQQYADAMRRLATKDALTGLYNKMAFDKNVELLEQKLADGDQNFGLVMIDLNNLKTVNDTYGHDKGDIAIRKISSLIREVFNYSPVYRVGGDEFVVVLKGRECQDADNLIEQFNRRTQTVSSDSRLDPWERVSAAIGYARYDETLDDGVRSVLVRADQEMYMNKGDLKRE